MLPNNGMLASTGKPNSFCSSSLLAALPLEIGRGVWMLKISVAYCVPFLVIDAVQDADQRAVALAQQAIQAAAQFFRGDFARIPRADGRDDIGIHDARLQAAHLAVEFHPVRSEVVPRQIQSAHTWRLGTVPGRPGYEWSGRSRVCSPAPPASADAEAAARPGWFASRAGAAPPASRADAAPGARRLWKRR